MADPFNVRIFAYRGLRQIMVNNPQQKTDDSVFVLDEPYEWSQLLVANNAAPARSISVDTSPPVNGVQILRIEVPDGKSIRYEICPPDREVDAGDLSPILSGHDQFLFQPGWTISIVDAASFE